MIKSRIKTARNVYLKMKNLFGSCDLRLSAKMKLIRCYMCSQSEIVEQKEGSFRDVDISQITKDLLDKPKSFPRKLEYPGHIMRNQP